MHKYLTNPSGTAAPKNDRTKVFPKLNTKDKGDFLFSTTLTKNKTKTDQNL